MGIDMDGRSFRTPHQMIGRAVASLALAVIMMGLQGSWPAQTQAANGQKAAEGRIEHTQCCLYLADEGADLGVDEGMPDTEDYKERDNKFTAEIHSLTIELKETKTANTDEMKQAMQEAAKRKTLSD